MLLVGARVSVMLLSPDCLLKFHLFPVLPTFTVWDNDIEHFPQSCER